MLKLSSGALLDPSGPAVDGKVFTLTDAPPLTRFEARAAQVERRAALVSLRGTAHDLRVPA